MSLNNTSSNDNFHKESGTEAVKAHLRAFEQAKRDRIARANANTVAGAALRKKSAAQSSSGLELKPDAADPSKTSSTSERHQEGTFEQNDAKMPESWGPQHHKTVSTREVSEEAAGHQDSVRRKSSIGQIIAEQAFKAATGYTKKGDEYGRYPI